MIGGRKLVVEFIGDERQLSRTFGRVATQSQSFGRKMQTAAIGIGKFAEKAGIAGVAVAVVSGKMQVDFQSSMEQIHTQAGATQGEVDKLSKSILNLAKSGQVSQGPQQLAQGLFHLESVGLRGAKAMNALKVAAQGAAVGHANLEDTATALGSAWLVNIKGAGNLHHVMALLNATVGAGNVRMGDLVQALGTGLLPASKQAGLSIKDVFGAMAVFTDEGYQASSAAAQFGTALHFLYNPTTKAVAAFQSIHLKSNALAADMHKRNGLLVALRDLKSHLDKTFPPGSGKALPIAVQQRATDKFRASLEAAGVSGKKLTDQVAAYRQKLKDMGSAAIAQEQTLGQILPGGRGRILLTLLNQLGRYQMKLGQVGKGTKNFADDLAKTQQTASYKINAAWATIQSELIQLGAHVVPAAADEFSKLAGILGDNKLSGDQKLKALTTNLSELASKYLPQLANAVGKEAPKVAEAFFTGFTHANAWGRLAIGGFLLTKLGQWDRVFGTAGTRAGAAAGVGFSKGMKESTSRSSVASSLFGGSWSKSKAIYQTGRALGAGPVAAGLGAFGAAPAGSMYGAGRGLRQLTRGLGDKVLRGATIYMVGDALGSSVHGAAGAAIRGGSRGAAVGSLFGPGGMAIGGAVGALDSVASRGSAADKILSKFGRDADQALQRAASSKNIGGLYDLANRARDLAQAFPADARAFRQFGATIDAQRTSLSRLANGFDSLRAASASSLGSIARVSRQDMAAIAAGVKDPIQASKDLSTNFGLTAGAIKRSMDSGVTSAKAGLAAIADAFRAELQAIGYKGDVGQAVSVRSYNLAHPHDHRKGAALTNATGGYIVGRKGEKGPDNVHMMLPAGWAVINSHQQAALGLAGGGVVPAVVGRGEMLVPPHQQGGYEMLARANGYDGLDGLFRDVRTPHYLAGGGRIKTPEVLGRPSALKSVVQAVLGKADDAANARLDKLAAAAGPSYNGPVGLNGLVPQVLRAIAWARRHGWHGSILSGFRSLATQTRLYAQLHGKSPVAAPGSSLHELGEAIDVSDILGFLAAMQTAPADSRLYSLVPGDPEHFSVTGHASGGFTAFKSGGISGKIASVPKKARKLPKGSHRHSHHAKRVGGTDIFSAIGMNDLAEVLKAQGINIFGVQIGKRSATIADVLGNLDRTLTHDVPALQERYTGRSNVFDLEDLQYVVTPDNGGAPYIDNAAVTQRVGEINELLGYEGDIKGKLESARDVIGPLLRNLTAGIRTRKREAEKVRARIRANLAKIKALENKIRQEQRASLPKGKGRAAAISARNKRINAMQDKIRGLKDDNQRLGGNRDSLGSGGALGKLDTQITNWSTSADNVRQDRIDIQGYSGIGGILGDTNYTILSLNKQLGELDPDALAKALKTAGGGSSSSSDANATLLGLVEQNNADLAQKLAVSQAQYPVFANLPPFIGSFASGGRVPAPRGAAVLAEVHGQEKISRPGDDDGEIHVHVHVHDGAVDERKIEVIAERTVRGITRSASGRLPSGGGFNWRNQ